jgi:glycerophosphoryl diester phosphodiesterase
MQAPLVIGHRGASGHRPEHTAAAYRAAWRSGADSVEPDVLSTRDGVLVCRHDLELSSTTDIAARPEFAARRRELEIDGRRIFGWFVHDLDLAELRTLRARERWPDHRPGSARFDDHFGLVTLEELLELRRRESERAGRVLGVHLELKHTALLAGLGLDVRAPLVELLRRQRLTSALSPVSVMAFEDAVLRRLRADLDVELVQLIDAGRHAERRTRRSALRRVSSYADAVGLHHELVLPRDRSGRVVGQGPAVRRARDAGLDVLVWTVRNENRFLPTQLRRGAAEGGHGDGATLVRWLLDLGVDGVLTDFPETAVQVRHERRATGTLAG